MAGPRNPKFGLLEIDGVDLDTMTEYSPNAEDIGFNNTVSGLSANQVQAAIDEIANTVQTSASPGFSFGRSGNIASGAFLSNEGVPSNKSGRYVYINNAQIKNLFVSNENINTFTLEIYAHDGNEINITLLGSINVVASRGGSFPLSLNVSINKQIAIKLSSGSAKNIVVGLELTGSN